jgi:hypothetical protein
VPTLEETTRQLLALPREAGTPEAARARELVTAYLEALGYDVVTQGFTFAPSSLRAFPIFGAGLGWLALVLFPLLVFSRPPEWVALAVWVGGLAALIVVSTGIGLGWVSLGEPLREDANLIATRGQGTPTRWIVAHLDSKAQAHSMAGRLVAVWFVGLAVTGLSALAVFRFQAPVSVVLAGPAVVCAVMAGVLAGRGRLAGRSLGARDNGTGVVAALAAAAVSDDRIAILITGAEEFGLVGARVFARLTPNLAEAEFVNIDTVDQEGKLYLVSHNRIGDPLVASLESQLAELTLPIKRRRLPLGIFVDSAPLASARARAVTVGRLTWRTLRCIHTPADTPDGLSFRTAEQVGAAITFKRRIDV